MLLEARSVAFLRGVKVLSKPEGPGGTVIVRGEIVGDAAGRLTLDLRVGNEFACEEQVAASPAGTAFQITAHISRAEPWLPAGLGAPKLHSVRLELHGNARTLDVVERAVGFRPLVLAPDLTSADHEGRAFGVAVEELRREMPFGQCDAVGPASSAPHRTSETLTIRRITGGPMDVALYDPADRQGVLLCQCFPMAGGYSNAPELQDEAVRQARVMVQQLGHHPAIVAWSCHLDPTEQNRALDTAVREAITQLDPTRPCL